MACMEHLCVKCGELVFNNTVRYHQPCSKCGCKRWASTWDEELDFRQRAEEDRKEREEMQDEEDLDAE